METKELVKEVKRLALEAGAAILKLYNRPVAPDVVKKSDNSPVTEADLASHRILAAALPGLLDVPVLSEEADVPAFAERSSWRCYWLVDPLDGTREFLTRNGEFTVNIALVDSGRPVLGVVYVPATGVTYYGAKDMGAFRVDSAGERAIAVRRVSGVTPVVVTSRRHGKEEVAKLVARLTHKTGGVVIRQIGSSLKFCVLAEGKADFYPRLTPTSEWDTAAAQAVLEAAGGEVLDSSWQPLRYNRKSDLRNPPFYAIGDVEFEWRDALFGN